MNKKIIVIGILAVLLLISSNPITIGFNANILEKDEKAQNIHFSCFDKREFNSFKLSKERKNQKKYYAIDSNEFEAGETFKESTISIAPSNNKINSPWPMYCSDVHNTGRSPYSTENNVGYQQWYYFTWGWIDGGVVIGEDDTIYFGSQDWKCNDYLYALYQNGTLKWKCKVGGNIECTPAISEDGTIYVGTSYGTNGLYAISSDGNVKWRYKTGHHVHSSPAIDKDGTIIFGDWNGYINALYPDGTVKWRYKTNDSVLSSPAIGDNGVVYCGSHDNHLYAIHSNDGTLKWKYKTGGWVRVSPCIGDDGTIFFVSFDCNLYAVNPDGTLKWKTNMGEAGTGPTIGHDGTIYAGYTKLRAFYPNNGTTKWTYNPGNYRYICGSTPANSLDGTIYFGTNIGPGRVDGGELIAVNPHGTEKWRSSRIANEWIDSPCAISKTGTIYIGTSSQKDRGGNNWHSSGEVHAFNALDPNAPSAPVIDGPTNKKYNKNYNYSFISTSPLDKDIYYYIQWGDGSTKNWIGPYASGETVTLSHKWSEEGTYTIKSRAKDTDNLWGPWGVLKVTMTKNKAINKAFFKNLQNYESEFTILNYLIKLIKFQKIPLFSIH